MPSFDVTINGKTYHVEVPNPAASPLEVIVDGQAFQVTVASSVPSVASVKLAEPPPPAPQPTPLPPLPNIPIARPVMPAGADGGLEITSPMPGTILAVEVKIGQKIGPGQVVCVLEAMKMKNPIRATVGGTVAEVAVQPGQTVAYGDLLVRLA
ncbi:MAG: biotin/lipoyl-containing protein [Anaerolineae bacterium]